VTDSPGVPVDAPGWHPAAGIAPTPLAVPVTRGIPRQTGFERRADDPRAAVLVAVVLCGAGKCERELARVYAAAQGTVDVRTLDQERQPKVRRDGPRRRARWMREWRVSVSDLAGWRIALSCDRHGYRRIGGDELQRAVARFGGRAGGPEVVAAVPEGDES
jgi:hypothetical protein